MDLSYVNLLSHIYNQFYLKLDHCIIQLLAVILVYHSGIMPCSTDMVRL